MLIDGPSVSRLFPTPTWCLGCPQRGRYPFATSPCSTHIAQKRAAAGCAITYGKIPDGSPSAISSGCTVRPLRVGSASAAAHHNRRKPPHVLSSTSAAQLRAGPSSAAAPHSPSPPRPQLRSHPPACQRRSRRGRRARARARLSRPPPLLRRRSSLRRQPAQSAQGPAPPRSA